MSCLTSTVVEQLDTPRQQAIPIRARDAKGFFAMDFTFLNSKEREGRSLNPKSRLLPSDRCSAVLPGNYKISSVVDVITNIVKHLSCVKVEGIIVSPPVSVDTLETAAGPVGC